MLSLFIVCYYSISNWSTPIDLPTIYGEVEIVDFHIPVLHSLLKRRLLLAFTQSPIKLISCTILN
ncbi:hypothetical protein [Microcoleus sp. B13-B4]|uniref:hypothetical protein n=1 Tax=unclassified Microcoleus TaxID=2642155 RepID=UPI002FD24954